jgi:hypothetical protein
MKSTYSIALVGVVLLARSAAAQETREAITTAYYEALPLNEARSAVDPALSMEGISSKAVLDDLTPGYVIFDGDIQIRIEELEALLDDPTRAVFGTVNYWGSTVPYEFSGLVSVPQQVAAIDAMNAVSAKAGVTFRPRVGGDADWIRFNASTFNNSPVGRQGGQQIINIVSWGTQVIIIHEIYHSLGFWHEQSATDRDTYVTINFGNICGSSGVPGNQCHPATCQGCSDGQGGFMSCAFNFNTAAGTAVWGPYDFDSFMHYGRTAFTCNGGDTITVNAPWTAQWQSLIGQRDHYGLLDELSCRGIYPYNGDRWLRAGSGGTNSGTFFNPYNGTFASAYFATPLNGTMLIDPGTYSGIGTYAQARTVRATYGTVTIGN